MGGSSLHLTHHCLCSEYVVLYVIILERFVKIASVFYRRIKICNRNFGFEKKILLCSGAKVHGGVTRFTSIIAISMVRLWTGWSKGQYAYRDKRFCPQK